MPNIPKIDISLLRWIAVALNFGLVITLASVTYDYFLGDSDQLERTLPKAGDYKPPKPVARRGNSQTLIKLQRDIYAEKPVVRTQAPAPMKEVVEEPQDGGPLADEWAVINFVEAPTFKEVIIQRDTDTSTRRPTRRSSRRRGRRNARRPQATPGQVNVKMIRVGSAFHIEDKRYICLDVNIEESAFVYSEDGNSRQFRLIKEEPESRLQVKGDFLYFPGVPTDPEEAKNETDLDLLGEVKGLDGDELGNSRARTSSARSTSARPQRPSRNRNVPSKSDRKITPDQVKEIGEALRNKEITPRDKEALQKRIEAMQKRKQQKQRTKK